MKMKYISFSTNLRSGIILFPESMDHDTTCLQLNINKQDILGAGFVGMTVDTHELYCYGHSVSLEIRSRGSKDTAMLLKHLGL